MPSKKNDIRFGFPVNIIISVQQKKMLDTLVIHFPALNQIRNFLLSGLALKSYAYQFSL